MNNYTLAFEYMRPDSSGSPSGLVVFLAIATYAFFWWLVFGSPDLESKVGLFTKIFLLFFAPSISGLLILKLLQ